MSKYVKAKDRCKLSEVDKFNIAYEMGKDDGMRKASKYIDDIVKEFNKIVEGIDKDEIETESGWWETSDGAKFGAGIKVECEALLCKKIAETIKHTEKLTIEKCAKVAVGCLYGEELRRQLGEAIRKLGEEV